MNHSNEDAAVVSLPARSGPLGLVRGSLRLALISPLHVLRGRRLFALGLLVSVPAIVAGIAASFGARDVLGVTQFVEFMAAAYLDGILPLVMIFLGAAALGDDVEDGTMLFLRLRPLPTSAIVLGRYLATVISALALFLPPIAALYLVQVGGAGAEFVGRNSQLLLGAWVAAAGASVAWGALFLCLGLLIKRAVVVGLIVMVAMGVIGNVPAPIAKIAIGLHLKVILDHFGAECELISQPLEALDAANMLPTFGESLGWLALGAAAILAIACLLFARREFLEKS